MHALFIDRRRLRACDVAVACAALYLLPVLIGWIRRVPDIGSVAVINVLLGWTLVGWAAALAMALRSPRPAPPAVQVVQHFPRPALAGPAGRSGLGRAARTAAARPGTPPPLTLPPRAQASADSTSSREYQ